MDGYVPSGKAQGVVALIRPLPASTLDGLLAEPTMAATRALILVVEEVQDPRNLGSLIRSAEAAGCHGVIVTQHRSAPLTGIVSKTSAGAVHHLPLVTAGNMTEVLKRLKDHDIWTVGLSAEAGQPLWEYDFRGPTALVVGGEGKGLRRLTAQRVDSLVSIPMRGRVASLNASVAGAVALYEAVRQRSGRAASELMGRP